MMGQERRRNRIQRYLLGFIWPEPQARDASCISLLRRRRWRNMRRPILWPWKECVLLPSDADVCIPLPWKKFGKECCSGGFEVKTVDLVS